MKLSGSSETVGKFFSFAQLSGFLCWNAKASRPLVPSQNVHSAERSECVDGVPWTTKQTVLIANNLCVKASMSNVPGCPTHIRLESLDSSEAPWTSEAAQLWLAYAREIPPRSLWARGLATPSRFWSQNQLVTISTRKQRTASRRMCFPAFGKTVADSCWIAHVSRWPVFSKRLSHKSLQESLGQTFPCKSHGCLCTLISRCRLFSIPTAFAPNWCTVDRQ